MEKFNFDMAVDYKYLATAWVTSGGSFVSALGEALMYADPLNRVKILENFEDYVAEYIDEAREIKARDILNN